MSAPLSSLDPMSLEDDLTVVTFTGLGRGRGFSVASRVSALGDQDISYLVANRICHLCKLFLDKGVISEEHVKKELEIGTNRAGASGSA